MLQSKKKRKMISILATPVPRRFAIARQRRVRQIGRRRGKRSRWVPPKTLNPNSGNFEQLECKSEGVQSSAWVRSRSLSFRPLSISPPCPSSSRARIWCSCWTSARSTRISSRDAFAGCTSRPCACRPGRRSPTSKR